MTSTYTAFFDANVFYGARLRSLILYAAGTKVFRARWSNQVHEEWIENLIQNRPDLKPADLEKTRKDMDRAVPDCLVEGYESLVAGVDLPDPNDRHIVAAAILARASIIVTFNLKDFPEEKISQFRLHAKHPDDFLIEAMSLAPVDFVECAKSDFRHYTNPTLTFEDYISSLEKAGVPKFAKKLAELKVLFVG